MDTDAKLIFKAKNVIKRTVNTCKYKVYSKQLTVDASNQVIYEKLMGKEPFLVSRFGSNEAKICCKYLLGKKYSQEDRFRITMHAGVFPDTDESINNFASIYSDSIKNIDHLGIWYPFGEGYLIKKLCKNELQLTGLRGIEPYYCNQPWSQALEGKKILVIHPFKKTIESQYYNYREQLFIQEVLPEFESLEVIRAVQSIAGQSTDFTCWSLALEYMKEQIRKQDFDIAIVGAGAYGLPLASYIKTIGKKAIHLGGATQILFGIKGNRWNHHEYISRLYNEAWVKAEGDEIPENKEIVEGGSYW